MNDRLTAISTATGLIIGVVGGVLAFASGAALLTGVQQAPMMSAGLSRQNQVLALWLFALGAAVIITAVVSLSSLARGRRGLLAGSMVTYGIVMLVVGGSMAGGLISMMSTPVYGYAMVVSGMLMVANGSIMSRRRMMM